MQQANPITREQMILNLAGSLSLTAALIHATVMPEHFQEWWGYGLFFLVVAIAQTLYGVGLILSAWGATSTWASSSIWKHHARAFYVAGIVGNIAIIALYVISRTSGIPLGPHAGETEPFSTIGVVSKMVELALVGCLMLLLVDTRSSVAISREA
jgi:hypothetical protein